jgi:hypothetical protein
MDEAVSLEKGFAETEKVTYKRDKAAIAEIRMKDRAYIQNLQNLVDQLVNQVNANNVAGGGNKFMYNRIDSSQVDSFWDLLVDNGDGTFSFHPDLSPEAQNALIAKAQEDIGENGYYGVKQTSQRLIAFAKAVTGGDPSKIDMMREYIDKGFNEVKKMFGGSLPDICNQTYAAVMQGLDDWAAGK